MTTKQIIVSSAMGIKEMDFEQVVEQYEDYIQMKISNFSQHYKNLYTYEQADCYNRVLLGVWNAFNKYDIDKGFTFLTYANWHIKREMGVYANYLLAGKSKILSDSARLDKEIRNDDTTTGADLLVDEHDYYNDLLIDDFANKIREQLKDSDKEIFDYMYNDFESITLEEYGQQHGITRQAVHIKIKRLREKISKMEVLTNS